MGIKEAVTGAAMTMGAISGLGTPAHPTPSYTWEQAGNAMQGEREQVMEETVQRRQMYKEPDVVEIPM